MYVFLLILGAVITAAGIVLLAPGVPVQGQEFDASIITPGAVAVVGGLILIGLGLAVRVLGRIERALATRQMPRAVRPAEAAAADASVAEEPSAPAPIPFPPKPAAGPRPQAPATAAEAVPSEDAGFQRLREKFPTLLRLDSASVTEEADVPLLPQPPVRIDEEVDEVHNAVVASQGNGAAPARTVRRLDVNARPSGRSERARSFDAFLPTRLRPVREVQTAAAQPAVPAEPVPDLQPATTAPQAPAPVSILKSGVVDGMAYTLYSDGSIEAALPQGTLRFGSITELRNHIEQTS